ncbi:hypothetical protein CEUSTIGMA_g1547.t1 [Chlamydomonas eustigma]|uniref:Bromo domain-containing protein n=1 Tax=Chlamydomonas eustigma TaxID=1157962 RepID=A0A250WTE9_9CHLO|nr:hypothetical protein CEUSTIGMA_g1547.t1 [Chlamydomonas eustigma]|eukprot:GAX74098.1 hypothetical protein CEUSTIGMA_g1547.t1 [Chlamydomonas eustigma]
MKLKLKLPSIKPPQAADPASENGVVLSQVEAAETSTLVIVAADSKKRKLEAEEVSIAPPSKRQSSAEAPENVIISPGTSVVAPPVQRITSLKFTIKRPDIAGTPKLGTVPALVAQNSFYGNADRLNEESKQRQQLEKQGKERQRQTEKDERQRAKAEAAEVKLRQKAELAQEKLRQKTEADQEKKRAADQANIIKTIKLKIVSGSSGVQRSSASLTSAPSLGAMMPPPPPPTRQMAPSSMFLSSTGPSSGAQRKEGKHLSLKPKIKLSSSMAHRPSNLAQRTGSQHVGQSSVRRHNGAPGLADRASLEKILNKIQAKDLRKIFYYPVTEAVAPNYFNIIQQPMDFSTMHSKLAQGMYTSWDQLQEDLDLIFNNCMTYNPPGSIYHLEGKKMQEVSRKLVELGRQGVTNFRGRTAGITRSHNTQINAEIQRLRADENGHLGRGLRHPGEGTAEDGVAGVRTRGGASTQGPVARVGGVRAAAAAANVIHPSGPRTSGFRPNLYNLLNGGTAAPPTRPGRGRGSRAAGGTMGIVRRTTNALNAQLQRELMSDTAMDGEARVTFRPRAAAPQVPFASWSALANGASACGNAFANGRPLLVSNMPEGTLNPDVYLTSVSRFMTRWPEAVRKQVMRRLLPCVAVEGAELPPEPPEPPPVVHSAPTAPSLPSAYSRPLGPPPPSKPGPTPMTTVPPLNLGAAAPSSSVQGTSEYQKIMSLFSSPNGALAVASLLQQQSALKAAAGGAAAGMPNKAVMDSLAMILQQQQQANKAGQPPVTRIQPPSQQANSTFQPPRQPQNPAWQQQQQALNQQQQTHVHQQQTAPQQQQMRMQQQQPMYMTQQQQQQQPHQGQAYRQGIMQTQQQQQPYQGQAYQQSIPQTQQQGTQFQQPAPVQMIPAAAVPLTIQQQPSPSVTAVHDEPMGLPPASP